MTGTDLATRTQDTALERLTTDQLRFISGTEFIPAGLRGNLPAILACIATGRELGLGDMESLREIHVIDGKPSMSAKLMARLVRKRGHSLVTVTKQNDKVTVRGRRRDTGDVSEVTWTAGDADKAKLLNDQKRPAWQKYTRQMLWNRAVSELCRELFSDCLGGVAYTPEEAELTADERAIQATAALPVVEDVGEPNEGRPQPAHTGTALPEAAASSDPERLGATAEANDAPEPSPTQTSFAELVPEDVRRQYEDRG